MFIYGLRFWQLELIEMYRSSHIFFEDEFDNFWDYYYQYQLKLFYMVNGNMASSPYNIKNIILYEFFDFVKLMQIWWHDSTNTELDEELTRDIWRDDVNQLVDDLEHIRRKD